MFSPQLRYFLYGTILSASLISLSVSAGTVDGVFGDYFRNIIDNPCTNATIVTGFDNTPATYGTPTCTTLQSLLASIFGSSIAPTGQAVVGFDVTTGNLRYGDVGAFAKVTTGVAYTGGNVGIGTEVPGATVSMSKGLTINGLGQTQLTVEKNGVPGFAMNINDNHGWTLYDRADSINWDDCGGYGDGYDNGNDSGGDAFNFFPTAMAALGCPGTDVGNWVASISSSNGNISIGKDLNVMSNANIGGSVNVGGSIATNGKITMKGVITAADPKETVVTKEYLATYGRGLVQIGEVWNPYSGQAYRTRVNFRTSFSEIPSVIASIKKYSYSNNCKSDSVNPGVSIEGIDKNGFTIVLDGYGGCGGQEAVNAASWVATLNPTQIMGTPMTSSVPTIVADTNSVSSPWSGTRYTITASECPNGMFMVGTAGSQLRCQEFPGFTYTPPVPVYVAPVPAVGSAEWCAVNTDSAYDSLCGRYTYWNGGHSAGWQNDGFNATAESVGVGANGNGDSSGDSGGDS